MFGFKDLCAKKRSGTGGGKGKIYTYVYIINMAVKPGRNIIVNLSI
jgi:hypothetical protein